MTQGNEVVRGRLTMEEMGRLTLEEMNHRFVWHPFTQMRDWRLETPVIIESGSGVKIRDTLDREYFDANSSMWVNLHGHRHPRLDRAIIEQLGRIAHPTMLGLANVPATELAARLVAIAPPGLTRVFYSDSGSEAVEVAIKMAIQYWQHRGKAEKTLFISPVNAYHGDTMGSVSIGRVEIFHSAFRPLIFPTEGIPSPYCYRCPLDRRPETCGLACLEPLERLLAQEGDRVAAVVIEPGIQAAGGMITLPPGYLSGVRALCTRYGALLIADEVATGFGRTGRMFACEHEGVSPDLMVVAKGITGGYLPLAATLATEEIYEAFLGEYREMKTFFHGHSYTGNQLACAVALENLKLFADEDILGDVRQKVALVRELLRPLSDLSHVGDIRQCGLMVGIELVRDRATREPYRWEEAVGVKVCRYARDLGLNTRPLGPVIVFMPHLSSSADELATMIVIIGRAIAAVTGR